MAENPQQWIISQRTEIAVIRFDLDRSIDLMLECFPGTSSLSLEDFTKENPDPKEARAILLSGYDTPDDDDEEMNLAFDAACR